MDATVQAYVRNFVFSRNSNKTYGDDEGVEVAGAADLELGVVGVLSSYLDGLGILSAGLDQEVLDLLQSSLT